MDELVVAPLTLEELDLIAWSGSPAHLRSVAGYLARDDVDYLTLRNLDGEIVAKGLIDFGTVDDAGKIEQLAVRPELQSRGIGSRLIAEMEQRIAGRGRSFVVMGVEHDNPRARVLYERLGYVAFDEVVDSWEREREDGSVYMYSTNVTQMRKALR